MALLFSILSAIWSHPWGRTIMVGVCIFLFGMHKGWEWSEVGKEAAVTRAITDRDAHWEEVIRKSNQEHENDLQEARKEADSIKPARDRDMLIRLCRDPNTNSDCREKGIYGVSSIQKRNVVR